VIEGQVISSSLAVRDEQVAAPALFGTTDPVEVIAQAVKVADALKDVLVQKGLIKKIKDKQYPVIEAWETLAAMLRITTTCEWTRPIEKGWECRIIVRDSAGNVIGSAENQCTREEAMWKSRDDYAIRSMAQTRTKGKALRSILGFIMVLAGYEATPAEEMPVAPVSSPAEAIDGKSLMARAVALGCCDESKESFLAWLGSLPESEPKLSLRTAAIAARALDRALDAEAQRPAATPPNAENAVQAGMSEAQRKLYFVLCGELGYDDRKRHKFNELITGKKSSSEFTDADTDKVIRELNRRIDLQNTRSEEVPA